MASDNYDDPRDDRDDEPARDEDREDRVIRRAKEKIKAPAILLLIVGCCGAIASLMNVPGLFTLDAQIKQVEDEWDKDPNLKDDQKKEMKRILNDMNGPIKVGVPMWIVFSLGVSALSIFASIRIMNLKSRGLGILATVLAMIPCFNLCCWMGLPSGIWVLIVMGKPEVKAGFAAVARGSRSEY